MDDYKERFWIVCTMVGQTFLLMMYAWSIYMMMGLLATGRPGVIIAMLLIFISMVTAMTWVFMALMLVNNFKRYIDLE